MCRFHSKVVHRCRFKEKLEENLLTPSCHIVLRKFLTVPVPVNGPLGAWNDAATLH